MTSNFDTNDISVIEEERDNGPSHHAILMASSSQNFIFLSNNATQTKGTPTDDGVTSDAFWNQWMHTGEYGLNTIPVWQDYTGEGIRVGLIDDGFNYNHSELSTNFRTDLDYDVLSNDDDSINDSNDLHGTWTAQVIGADDNGVGNVGVAFDADLVGIRRGFNGEGSTADTLEAFQYALDNDFDIVNNSWGTTASFGDNKNINFSGTDTSEIINKFEDLVEFGRDGLGANIVFSAGNGREQGLSANYKNYQNSPYTIAVASHNEGGTYSYFSEAGSNVLISAPGESIRLSNAFDNGNGTLVSGTSFSAPAVSGVIALMLEANADLGYRDVQEILAMSSRMIDADGTGWANEGWQFNGASNWNGTGMHFSHDYGYGAVDALAAVRLAETWTTQKTFSNMSVIDPVSSAAALVIPATGTVTTTITITEDISIEHILIDLDITHTKAGDLTVTLISPTGTESTLIYNINNGAYTTTFGIYNGVNFEFSSVAHWGESSHGEWTLEIQDNVAGNSGTLNNWSLSFLGSEQTVDDVFVYTDELGYVAANTDTVTLTDWDESGIDTINAAAVTTNTTIDLSAGGTLVGKNFIIAEGTIIENLYTGDGNDSLSGNFVNNTLNGGRGDDLFYGSLGNDTLDGGLGTDTVFYNYNIGDFVFDLIDDFTVGLTNAIDNFTDTLFNMEFFNFNGDNYSRTELNDYVTSLSEEVVATKLYLGWGGKTRTSVVNEEKGDFTYTAEELGRGNYAEPLLEISRGVTSLEATSLYIDGTQIESATIRNNDLTDVSLTGFLISKIIQTDSTHDVNALINYSATGKLYTGSGNDTLTVNMHHNVSSSGWLGFIINSGAGDDVVFLNSGADKNYTKTYLGEGNNALFSGPSNNSKDWIYGGSGNDEIHAGGGDDRIYGYDGFNEIHGGNGNDRIYTGADEDQIYGDDGSDRIVSGAGNDYIEGGAGNDVIYTQDGDDEAHGGSGNDYLRGQNGNDILYGDDGFDKIYGEDGNDTLYGGAGVDYIHGGLDNDYIDGGADSDKLYGNAGDDEIHGGAGFDYINGGSGNDIIFGGNDNDKLYGGADNDRLDGGAGNDYLYAGYGDDVMLGGDGSDRFYGASGKDVFAFTTADGNWDYLYNFGLGYDVINITDVLEGYEAGVDDLNDFVRFIAGSGEKTYMQLNIDGDAGGVFTTEALIFKNFNGQGVDDLLANNTLIADISA